MKLLHIGDVHLGKRQYRSDIRYEDYFDTFQEAVDIAIEQDVTAVIQTGDLFDTSNPSIETISRCIDILSDLPKNGIPFYAIVGNHERKQKQQWIDIINRVGKSERLTTTPTILSDEQDNLSVALYGIDSVRKPQWNTTDFTLEESSKDIDTRIVCMHELLSPPITGDNTQGMDTYDTRPVLDRFDMNIDVLALGDFHVPVDTSILSTYIYYGGATERTSMNQSHAVASLLNIDSSGSVERELINMTTARPFVSCEITFEDGDDITKVRKLLDEHDFTPPGKKDSVGVVELRGEDTGVTVSEVEQIVESMGAKVTHVLDRRKTATQISVNPDDLDEGTESIDDRVDEAMADIEFNETTEKIESIIRDDETPNSTVRDEVRNIFETDEDGSEDKTGDTQ